MSEDDVNTPLSLNKSKNDARWMSVASGEESEVDERRLMGEKRATGTLLEKTPAYRLSILR